MTPTKEQVALATELEKLVTKAIADFGFGLNLLRLPPNLQEPLWHALGRRAIKKAVECGREPAG